MLTAYLFFSAHGLVLPDDLAPPGVFRTFSMTSLDTLRAGDWHLLRRKDSTGSTGSNDDAMALLRIGSITLPSSMDLRQYLEQMQEVGEEEDGLEALDAAAAAAPPRDGLTPPPAAARVEADAIVQAPGQLTWKFEIWQGMWVLLCLIWWRCMYDKNALIQLRSLWRTPVSSGWDWDWTFPSDRAPVL